MEFVTAAEVLEYAGVKAPTDAETAWAETVAKAVNSGIEVRLNGSEVIFPSPAADELHLAAVYAGGEAYKRREAPFGVTGFEDLEGRAIRLARDYLEGSKPLIDRYGAGPGIG